MRTALWLSAYAIGAYIGSAAGTYYGYRLLLIRRYRGRGLAPGKKEIG